MFGSVTVVGPPFELLRRAYARRVHAAAAVAPRTTERPKLVSPAALAARHRVESATVAAVRSYTPRPYPGQIDLFVTADKWHRAHLWRPFAGIVREHHLPAVRGQRSFAWT